MIYSSTSNVEVHSSSFTNNSALLGGAMYLKTSSTVRLYSSIFSFNSASDGSALYVTSNGISLASNCTFKFNFGLTIICAESSLIHILKTNCYNNSGTACMFTRSSSVITDSLFYGGRSVNYGAIALIEVENFTSSNSILYDNQATNHGGALYSYQSISKCTNMTVERCRSLMGQFMLMISPLK